MSIPKKYWRDMPTTDFRDCADWIAVLPVAAIEQHGPHLPVGVDSFIAEGLIARAAAELPEDLPVTFLPLQQVGKSDEHVHFPGTLTQNWEVAIKAWIDIGNSVARSGVRKLVIITSHGGNNAAIDIVARDLRLHWDMLVVTTSWGRLGRWQEIYDLGTAPMIDIHGGLSETAAMLVHRSDLVDMDKAQDFASAQSGLAARFDCLGYHSASANIAWLAEDLNPDGPVGDAKSATRAAGEADIIATTEGFLTLMAEVAQMPPPVRNGKKSE